MRKKMTRVFLSKKFYKHNKRVSNDISSGLVKL